MAIVRPTLGDLREQVRGDADAILGGIDARLERGLLEVMLMAQVGALHEAYGYLQALADDLFPDTATTSALDRWAGLFGLSRGGATFAQGWIGGAGADPVGLVPDGTVFRRADGVEYERVATGNLPDGSPITPAAGEPIDWTLIGETGTGYAYPVRAVVSGEDGNLAAGASVSLVSPIANVPTQMSVLTTGIAGAVDAQTDEALRALLLARIQAPPQGGTAADYERWALEASTDDDPVTRVFVVEPTPGDNLVTVYVVDDGGGFPSANPPNTTPTARANVLAYITERKPLASRVDVLQPTLVALNLTLSIAEPAAEIVSAIENEIDGFLIDNHDIATDIPLSLLQSAINTAAGSIDVSITVPASNPNPGAGGLYYRGAITWT